MMKKIERIMYRLRVAILRKFPMGKGLIEIKPNIIPIPIKSREQEEKEFQEWGKQLLKKIAKAYRINAKDIKIIRRKVK